MSGQTLAEVLAATLQPKALNYLGPIWHDGHNPHSYCAGCAATDARELADVVTAWIEGRLTGAREDVAGAGGIGYLCDHTGPVVDDGCDDCRYRADIALAVVREALGIEVRA